MLPLWTVSASQGPVPSPVSTNPNRTGNLSLLTLWTVSAWQASIPGHLISTFTGPFGRSCLSVKSCSPVLLGPYLLQPHSELDKIGPSTLCLACTMG